MLRENYIKLSRNIMNSDYIDNAVLLRAFIGLMTHIRFQMTLIDGITVDVNEVLLKKEEIPLVFGSSKRQAYESLKRMERDGIIRWFNIRNKYTLIKVIKEDFSRDEEAVDIIDHRHMADSRRMQEGNEEKKSEDINNSLRNHTAAAAAESEASSEVQSEKKENGKSGSAYEEFRSRFQRQTQKYTYPSDKIPQKKALVLPEKRASAESRDPVLPSVGKNTLSDMFRKHYNSHTASQSSSEKVSEKPSGEPKLRYGEYNNVLLTRDEHNRLVMTFSDARKRIDEFSELLRTAPDKRGTVHFDEIMKLKCAAT